jgi:hypothetical protein
MTVTYPVIPVFLGQNGRSMRDRTPNSRKNNKLFLKLILEKCLSSAYTSIRRAKSRVLKLHRRLDGAGGLVQLASIRNCSIR